MTAAPISNQQIGSETPATMVVQRPDRIGESAVQVYVQQCLNYRGRQPGCNRCDDVCPTAALAPGLDAVPVDPERCTGCGACVPACPSGAIALAGFDPRLLVEALAQSGQARVRCSRSGHGGSATEVPCLQVLDARLLVAAAAAGMQDITLHGLERCRGCARGDARTTVDRICDDLKQWLGAAAPAVRIADPEPLPPDTESPRFNRRKLLRLAAIHASEHVLNRIPQETRQSPPSITTGVKPGHRPAAYQELFAAAVPVLEWRGGRLPLQARTINPGCNMCLVCSERCPTGALTVQEQDRSITILFQLARCTDCGLCERLCPNGAVVRTGIVDAQAIAEPPANLMQLPRQDCECCGKKFIAVTDGEKYCHNCAKEQAIRHDWLAAV